MTLPRNANVIDGNPIINDAFAEPTRYWHFGDLKPEIREGRRTAGYLAPSPDGQLRITDEVIALDLVNDLRNRVRRWRADGHPGVTAVTRDLLRHWFDDGRKATATRPFFCQQEAADAKQRRCDRAHPLLGGGGFPQARHDRRFGHRQQRIDGADGFSHRA